METETERTERDTHIQTHTNRDTHNGRGREQQTKHQKHIDLIRPQTNNETNTQNKHNCELYKEITARRLR